MTNMLKSEQNEILEAFENWQTDIDKSEAKWEEKRFKAIEPSITLAEGLSRLTKDDLTVIRTNLGIKGVSGLKKDALIEVLANGILEQAPLHFDRLEERRYRFTSNLVKDNGVASLEKQPVNPYLYSDFVDLGIVYTGKIDGEKSLVMPAELIEAFKAHDTASYRAIMERNTEWCKLAQGLLYYYGALNTEDFVKLFRKYVGEHDSSDTASIVVMYSDLYEYYVEDGIFRYLSVSDEKEIWDEHKLRPSLDYYPFSKEQLLQAGELGFVDRNQAYRAFSAFLAAQFDMSPEEAGYIADNCVNGIQAGAAMQDIIDELGEVIELEQRIMERLMGVLIPLMNQTRKWHLKGYSPDEFARTTQVGPLAAPPARAAADSNVISFPAGKKVGRNDPCPCGSGKKYKKCCGG
ncbi:YecA family protein [Paenibacillus soyae]|uniref:SEC-C metal-binding domain-containing protein n=1 Tax=Paenibacillus soyae TaxID=2969249 RepID=A0A9X2S6M1_9BACL|nr:SEC-C metal-binding domain-containing protein [Paenibacillus soyae]MCR2802311.1 SEC-C metal-binding domain-containing protein [Paenibacillus soyae]